MVTIRLSTIAQKMVPVHRTQTFRVNSYMTVPFSKFSKTKLSDRKSTLILKRGS